MEIEFVKSQEAPAAVQRTPPVPNAGTEGQPTSEELQARTFEAMGWEKPQPTAPPVVEPPAPATPIVAAPASPAPVAPAPAAPAVMIPDQSALIRQTAVAVGTEVARAMVRERPRASDTAVPFEMVEDDAEDYKIIQFLEASDKRYAGLAARFLAWIKGLYAYEEQWSAANPDKEFEASDAEHDAYYDANPTPVDRKTLDQAKIDMAVEEKYEEKMAPQLKQLKAERAWQANAPNVYLVANRQIVEMVKAVNPEMAAMLTDENGLPALSTENAAKAEEMDAIAYEVLNVSAKRLWDMVVELERTVLKDVEIKLNPANEVHGAIIRTQREEEARILRTPAEQNKGGLVFTTIDRWHQMAADEQAKHWILTVDDMEALLVKTFAEQAKKSIEHLDNLGKKKYVKAAPPAAARPTAPGAPAAPAPVAARKVQSPSFSSASDAVPVHTPQTPPKKSYGEEAVADHFR